VTNHRVLIIGAGIAGLSAASVLARFGVRVDLVERRNVVGGHAAQFACKATDRCVHCGACLVTEALSAAASDPRIAIHTASRVDAYRAASPNFEFKIIPAASAPPFDGPTAAADAVVLAAGFDVFDPQAKAYGHGIFPNVITNLELEQRLRAEGRLHRPSDGAAPRRVAFIQCVGSRDAKLGHLWCSHFCCAAALRAARRIKALRPATEISVFYIDIQSFGRDFESFYRQCRQELRFVRAIPSEAFEAEDARVRLIFSESALHPSVEEVFDLVVLSTGMVPAAELGTIAGRLGLRLAPSGFAADDAANGVFTAGAVRGPMTIADSVADARASAARVLAYLGFHRGLPEQGPVPTSGVCCHRLIPRGL
jgi:heterodisulfide reductase subunit A